VRRKVYRTAVFPLGLATSTVARNVDRYREQGWRLVSTYIDRNRNSVFEDPSVMGVFETWEKIKR
jgi:hypothetical protein